MMLTSSVAELVPSWGLLGIPLIAGVVLFVIALISIARNRTYTSGGTVVWALLVLALPLLGPLLWFLIGRRAPSPGETASMPKNQA
ncbi:MAG: PLDc N-terminal domain-containing protein [Arthrobacter sp.]